MHSRGPRGRGTEKIGRGTLVQLKSWGSRFCSETRTARGRAQHGAAQRGISNTGNKRKQCLTAGAHDAGRGGGGVLGCWGEGGGRGSAMRVWSNVIGRGWPRAKLGALQLKGARRVGESGGVGHGLSARLRKSFVVRGLLGGKGSGKVEAARESGREHSFVWGGVTWHAGGRWATGWARSLQLRHQNARWQAAGWGHGRQVGRGAGTKTWGTWGSRAGGARAASASKAINMSWAVHGHASSCSRCAGHAAVGPCGQTAVAAFGCRRCRARWRCAHARLRLGCTLARAPPEAGGV